MKSLRGTLLAALLAGVVAAILLAGVATYRSARVEIDDLFDYHLRQVALSLRDQRLAEARVPGGEDEGFDLVIQVWNAEGVRIYLSRPLAGLPDQARMGYATVHAGHEAWRVFSAPLRDQVIQVAQPLSVREHLAFSAALRTLLPFLLLLPLTAGLIWWIVGWGLVPIERLARAVSQRTPDALEPIPETGVPSEGLPLVRSLNSLLERLGAALENQRAFVADAAHELRTPLAALQLQVQLAQRAGSDEERAQSLAELQAGLLRASHVVAQLLTLARAEPGASEETEEKRVSVSLAGLVRQAVGDHARIAELKGIDLGATRLDEHVSVVGDPATLRVMLANLVDNAVLYCNAGARIDLSAGLDGGRPFVEVADNGPGIPQGERERVFARFYRRQDTAEGGSGLGLAIVKAIALRHGGRADVRETAGGGTTVRVSFAMPAPGAELHGPD